MITLGPTEKNVYPVVPVREGIVFPGTENVLIFGRAKSIGAINEALKGDKKFLLLIKLIHINIIYKKAISLMRSMIKQIKIRLWLGH